MSNLKILQLHSITVHGNISLYLSCTKSNYGRLLSRLKTEDLCAPSRLLIEVVDKIPRKRLYKFPPKNSLEVSVLLGVTGVVI